MTEHTPGPWEIFGMGDIVARKSSTSTYLTVKHNWECAPEKEIPERHANARLIAAAPDLLAAAEAALACAQAINPEMTAAYWQLDAAIARARGTNPNHSEC